MNPDDSRALLADRLAALLRMAAESKSPLANDVTVRAERASAMMEEPNPDPFILAWLVHLAERAASAAFALDSASHVYRSLAVSEGAAAGGHARKSPYHAAWAARDLELQRAGVAKAAARYATIAEEHATATGDRVGADAVKMALSRARKRAEP